MSNPIAIYVPDNPRLDDALDALPGKLKRYRDHARWLIHLVCARRAFGQADRDGYVRLMSLILREFVPCRVLTTIRRELVSSGVLDLSPYSVGCKSIGHRITPEFDGRVRQELVTDPLLCRKLRSDREGFHLHRFAKSDPEYAKVLKRRGWFFAMAERTLEHIGFDADPEAIYQEAIYAGLPSANADYSVCRVSDHDGGRVHVDPKGWRAHHLATYMHRGIRAHLTLSGCATVEVDIANSQPLLLGIACSAGESALFGREGTRGTPIMLRMRHYPVDISEVRDYTATCAAGELYATLSTDTGLPVERVKKTFVSAVLMGEPWYDGPVHESFRNHWPSIGETLDAAKREVGLSAVACGLQRLESEIIIDGAMRHLHQEHPDVEALTIHDSALVPVGNAEPARTAILDEFKEWGVEATVRIKGVSA